MGLRQVLRSLPATRRRPSRLAPLLQPSSLSSRHRRSHSYLSPPSGQPVATRQLAKAVGLTPSALSKRPHAKAAQDALREIEFAVAAVRRLLGSDARVRAVQCTAS